MTPGPVLAVAFHDGFYGAGTGAGYANRALLRTLAGILSPPVRLVVIPVYLAPDSPAYDAAWHRESLDICRHVRAVVRPADNGTAGQVRYGDVPTFRRLAVSVARVLAEEVFSGPGPGAAVFSDTLFLGTPPLLPAAVAAATAVVPRSTGLLHDPGYQARASFERDGLHYLASHGGRIAAISRYMRDHLIRDYHVPPGCLLDLPDGLTADEWSARPDPLPLPARAQDGFLLAFARAEAYKGWDDLIDALAGLRQRGVPVPHALLGAVTDQPEPNAYQRQLATRIAAHGLDATLLTRFDPGIRGLLTHQALRAVVIASRAEPFGRVPLEAYAAGAAPVVATTAGGLAEQVIDGVTGFTTAPADPPGLARAIESALGLPAADRARMREAGRRLARDRFDYDAAVRGFLSRFAPAVIT